ncbi:hypothetical protein B7P43_G01374, partial [Cryptotermes secundus]
MRSDKRSESFTFHTTDLDIRTQVEHGATKATRRRLQDRFDNECQCTLKSTKQRIETAQRRWTNLNFSSVSLPPIHPHRFLRSGADKLSKTLNNVRTTFGAFSQKFRSSTRRRHRLKNESPHSPVTPQSRSRHLLGRTPIKLYSPFGIESPCQRNVRSGGNRDKENETIAGRHTYQRRNVICSSCYRSRGSGPSHQTSVHDGTQQVSVYSPQQKFDSDLEEARIGIWELNQTANNIARHNLRH